MKKFIILLTILSLVVVMFSCTLQDEGGTTPTDPETITLTIVKPTSGDTLFATTSSDITWTSNTTQKLIIEYTIDNGENWELVTSDIENTGSHIWSPIPSTLTSQGRVKITTADSALNSISDGFFSIVQGTSKILSIIEPNGGEQWQSSSIQTIKWNSSGVDSVILEYTLDNGLNWTTITTNAQSTGFYNWNPLPSIPSTNAKVRVIDAEEGFPMDESDGLFSIEPADLLTVTMPNGGEEWLAGSSQYIKWNTQLDISPGSAIPSPSQDEFENKNINSKKSTFPTIETNSSPNSIETVENVKIEYSVNGAASWKTIIESTPNNGIYFWASLPNENSANCLIRVSDATDGVPFDFNDVAFSIFATLPQEIEIIAPNGGEAWAAGTSQEIKWSSKDVSFVKIEYTIDNGVNWISIVESTPSDGFYTWEQLPNGAASNCRIKISDATDGSPSDISNDLFSITPEPSINLTSPNGGEILQSGSSINITWTSVNIAKIKIEYTINGGAEWILIANDVESTGSYTWENIPDVNSSQVKVKVSDSDDGAPSDISENNLAISNQIVQNLEVTSPNGGEFWEANTAKNITWNSSAVTHVKIEFTANNGLSWEEVENNLPSSGSYDWKVPNVNSTQAKIRISDAIDGDPVDESNSTFRIKQAGTLKLISPETGDNWIAGELQRIEWEADNIEKVKIEFTTTNAIYDPTADWFDDAWFDLVTNAPGAVGFYETRFTIPSTEYRLRISDAEFDEPIDFSGLFTVKGQPSFTLQLTTPNGGENWIIGEPYEITWTSENVERISIDYSLNNGTTWDNIISDVPSNGLHNWIIPNIQNRSDLCKIRIQHATDSTIFDFSDAPFSIHAKEKLLRVVSPNGGEDVISGVPTRIEWTTADIEKVDIFFTIDNTATWHEIIRDYKSTGAYMWTPPDTSSSLARIKIVASDDASIKDESDSYFSIYKANDGLVQVLYPNGGEQLDAGGTAEIKWLTQNVANIKIEYSSNNGADWGTLIASTPTEPGIYSWDSVPTTRTSHGMIRISDATRSDIKDISDATFSVVNSTPVTESITITSPKGGEKWFVDDKHNIEWISENVGNVTLEYSIDGTTWITIASDISNVSPYSWTIPDAVDNSVEIRISEALDSNPSVTSNPFSIEKQTISLSTPNGGEVWIAGEYKTISWSSTNVENIIIEYSLNRGGAWILITTVSGTENQYIWNVPNEVSDNALIRVKDAIDNLPSDVSDAPFRIKPLPVIELISPNGGEKYTAGGKKSIRWTSENVVDVIIKFSDNNGGSWTTLTSSPTPSDGDWTWNIDIGIISANCAIKIIDATKEDVFDISETPFEVEEKIDQISGEPTSIYLVSTEPTAIGVTESGSATTAQITFEVQDSSGKPIDLAHAVDVSFEFGEHPNGGEFLAPSIVRTNESGQVTVNLTSGIVAGPVQIFAITGGGTIQSRPVNIAIHGGLPHFEHFTVASEWLNYPLWHVVAEDAVKVSALVGDRYSNPVREGTIVYFDTDAGVIDGSDLTNDNGFAVVYQHSGNPWPDDPIDGPGFFYVHANTIDENNASITTKNRVLFSGAPIVRIFDAATGIENPTVTIPDGGSQSFIYTVMDVNGNPMAHDNEFTVEVITEGDAAASGSGAKVKMADVQTGGTSYSFTVYDSKPSDVKPSSIIVKVSATGPNGFGQVSVSGTCD